jgi:23S rRNA pseudouridine1911/1915/1917 synthase
MKERPDDIESDWIQLEFSVPREYAGWRADRFVSNRIPRLSRTRVQRILRRAGFISSGRRIKPNHLLAEGEIITVFRPPPDEPEVSRYFGVLFEDETILAVNKPAGLPVHPTARYHHNTLTALLEERYGSNRPVLAHRIDSETSGIVLCAKTKDMERGLKRMFAERQVQKQYLAITNGIPDPASGRIEAPLGPDQNSPIRVKMGVVEDGLPSLTEYKVLKVIADTALVECRPRTGRQHQIRAHLSHLGYPIIGDKIYGFDVDLFLDYLDQGMTPELALRAGALRQLLHASQLSLMHPLTGRQLTIEAPLPGDMLRATESR